jgi:hypothetical protein
MYGIHHTQVNEVLTSHKLEPRNMSKGMWTKHFTHEGKAFYFNPALNRSVWNPPSDAITHEAPNAKSQASVGTVDSSSPQIPSSQPPPVINSIASEMNTVLFQDPSVISAPNPQFMAQPIPAYALPQFSTTPANNVQNSSLPSELDAQAKQM